MKQRLRTEVVTPADPLRAQIGEAETILANLKGAGPKALRLLELLDAMQDEREALAGAGLDLRPEEGRIESIQRKLRDRKAILLRELRPLGGLDKLRAGRTPAPENWWWHLDKELAAERRRLLRRYAIIAGVVAVLAGIAVVLYVRFLRPDPLTVAIYRNQNDAINAITAGKLKDAIPYIEENMRLAPEQAEWPIRLGVLEELAGDPARSQAAYEQGRKLAGDEVSFLLQRAQYYIEAGAWTPALNDAQKVAELQPQSAMAYYLQGRAYAGLGRRAEAVAAYEKTTQLAGKGQETLYVMAKLEMATLLQQIDLPQATPTPGR
jgi:tetratricopeptide (TPR) repeat protein